MNRTTRRILIWWALTTAYVIGIQVGRGEKPACREIGTPAVATSISRL